MSVPAAGQAAESRQPPTIDEAPLSPEQRSVWREVRARFIATERHVSRTQRLLDELSFRLRVRGFTLRDADVASATRMHGFVDASIGLITGLDFERAFQALARADYEHTRLRDVVGH